MTVRNDQLLEQFYEGIREGQNHTGTIQIVPVGPVTLLVGFENCIYAHRSENGVVTKYNGWLNEDTSSTTMRHIEAIEADVEKDNRPQILSWDEGLIKPDGALEIEDLQYYSEYGHKADPDQ